MVHNISQLVTGLRLISFEEEPMVFLTISKTHTLSLFMKHTLSLIHTHTLYTNTLSLTLSLYSLSMSNTLSMFSLSLSLSLSLTHTHTHRASQKRRCTRAYEKQKIIARRVTFIEK